MARPARAGQLWSEVADSGPPGAGGFRPHCQPGHRVRGHHRDPTGSLAGRGIRGWSSRPMRAISGLAERRQPSKRIPHRYATGVGEDGPLGQPKQAPPGSRV